MKYLGIDLGGTAIKTAVINEQYEIIASSECKSNVSRPWSEVLDDCCATALESVTSANLTIRDFSYVGLGTPGIVDVGRGVVEQAVNLNFFDVPIKDYIQKKLGIEVLVENDANAAAFGEFKAGVGKDEPKDSSLNAYTDLISITIGTGIGSGIIMDSKIFRGQNGLAGEIGHTVIDLGGRLCSCGRKGCGDRYASSRGLKATSLEFMEKYPDSIMWAEAGGNADGVSGRTAFRAAEKGDKAALLTLEKYFEALGAIIVNATSIFQPQIITLAGGISKEGEMLLEPLRTIAEKECLKGPTTKLPYICCGTLNNSAGVIGAALLGQ